MKQICYKIRESNTILHHNELIKKTKVNAFIWKAQSKTYSLFLPVAAVSWAWLVVVAKTYIKQRTKPSFYFWNKEEKSKGILKRESIKVDPKIESYYEKK